MNCPKCHSTMEQVIFASIEVDRCKSCRGIWFDLMEYEQLKSQKGSEIIDIGDADIGEQYNKIDKFDCPSCRSPMIRMVDNNQPHIWFEKCSDCHGTFLDAGEFRDVKDETLMDFVRDLFAKRN